MKFERIRKQKKEIIKGMSEKVLQLTSEIKKIECDMEKIIKEWRHDGYIGGWSSERIDFEIDEKEYVVYITEVKDGDH